LSYLNAVLQKIHFFNEELISTENFIKAFHLCKNIDEDDTTYVALSLELNAEFWTRDDILKEGLKTEDLTAFLMKVYPKN
jgi:predicted nucleic acid-binding protein